MGGEKLRHMMKNKDSKGSPPHRRGKEPCLHTRAAFHRITPAWAGKRSGQTACTSTRPDHPRMGGEKISMSSTVFFWQGSPPRGRGKVLQVAPLCAEPGITPAWAGKSCGRCPAGRCSGDHPRVGGEKLARLYSSVPVPGSPPRGRGKVQFGIHALGGVGITPAWAGKRPSHCSERRRPQDHPRVSGEKAKLAMR